MDIQRSAILATVFVSDPIDFKSEALILAFTIPEKKAYGLDTHSVAEIEERGIRSSDPQAAYRSAFLTSSRKLQRMPEWDIASQSEAVEKMFADGFYKADIEGQFYAGMGKTGFFMGLAQGFIESDNLVLVNGLSADLWKNKD